MCKKCEHLRPRKWAMISDQGSAMLETEMTLLEYGNVELRRRIEKLGLLADDCSAVRWSEVTENDAFYSDRPWYVLVDGQWDNDDGPKGMHALVHDKAGGIVAYFPDHEVADEMATVLNTQRTALDKRFGG